MQLTKQSRSSAAKWRRRFVEHRLNRLKFTSFRELKVFDIPDKEVVILVNKNQEAGILFS